MWWTRLTDWWQPRTGSSLREICVVMYTRRGCHLCADAWGVLDSAQRRYGFRLEAVDIDTDPELVRQYGEQVPVVTVNGKLRFRGCVNRVLLDRLLRAEAAKNDRTNDLESLKE